MEFSIEFSCVTQYKVCSLDQPYNLEFVIVWIEEYEYSTVQVDY